MAATDDNVMNNSPESDSDPKGLSGYEHSSEEEEAESYSNLSDASVARIAPPIPLQMQLELGTELLSPPRDYDELLREAEYAGHFDDPSDSPESDSNPSKKKTAVTSPPRIEEVPEVALSEKASELEDKVRRRRKRLRKHVSEVESELDVPVKRATSVLQKEPSKHAEELMDVDEESHDSVSLLEATNPSNKLLSPQGSGLAPTTEVVDLDRQASPDLQLDSGPNVELTTTQEKLIDNLHPVDGELGGQSTHLVLNATDAVNMHMKALLDNWAEIAAILKPNKNHTLDFIADDDRAALKRWIRDPSVQDLYKPRYLQVHRGEVSEMTLPQTNMQFALEAKATEYSVYENEDGRLLKPGGPLMTCRSKTSIADIVSDAVTARVNIARALLSDEYSEALHDQFYNNFNDVYRCDMESYHVLRLDFARNINEVASVLGKKENLTELQTTLMYMSTYGYGAVNIMPPAAIPACFKWSEQYAVKMNLGVTFHNWVVPVRPPWITYGKAKTQAGELFFLVICSLASGTGTMYRLRVLCKQRALCPYILSSVMPLVPGSVQVERILADLTELACFRAVIGTVVGVQITEQDITDAGGLLLRLLTYLTPWPNPTNPQRPTETGEAPLVHVINKRAPISMNGLVQAGFGWCQKDIEMWYSNTLDMFNLDKHTARLNVNAVSADCLLSYVYDAVSVETSNAVIVGYGADFSAWEGALGYIHRSFQKFVDRRVDELAYAFGICNTSKNDEGGHCTDTPYNCVENIRTQGAWFMYFFGFNNKLWVNPSEIMGTTISECLLHYGYTFRPAVVGVLPTSLELHCLTRSLSKSIRGLKAIAFKGPSDFVAGISARNLPKSKGDVIIKCFREVHPGTSFDAAVESMSTEYQNIVNQSHQNWQTIYYRICPKQIMPDPVIVPPTLPTHLLEPNQLKLLDWVAVLKTNPHHNSNGRGLFLRGDTETGKSAFMCWIRHYFRTSVLTSSGGYFLQGVRPTDEVLVFDDVDNIREFPDILKLLDSSAEMSVNIKYGTCVFPMSPRLVFISNKTFEEYFFTKDMSPDVKAALRRKIVDVHFLSSCNVFNGVKFTFRGSEHTGRVLTGGGVPAGLRWYTAPLVKKTGVLDAAELTQTICHAPKKISAPPDINYNATRTDLLAVFCEDVTDDSPLACIRGDELADVQFISPSDQHVAPEKALLEALKDKLEKKGYLFTEDITLLCRLLEDPTIAPLAEFTNKTHDDASRKGILCAIASKLRKLG